ncbi:TetR/AcrR family transcriptional regulator [Telmatospirillum siberiense]|uniref:TetR/AcrR family transcriptional regulator n=2 Tax=Telmatospirillum siberiense TaxID=382514 RepID=A0A2N3Q1I8_9PROT|nr:TetR/AcrR family transcriptional regulator [Telmatospirillum siberiense]
MIITPPATDTRQHILETAQRLMSQRGFTAVGLAEILKAARIPKGSFYYYFQSKDTFGKELLENYFSSYLQYLDDTLTTGAGSAADRLMLYFDHWVETQASHDPEGKCLAVKLGAEVADLSEAMRDVLLRGIREIIGRLAASIEDGTRDGSLSVQATPQQAAETLYHLWLGASLVAKIAKTRDPLISALTATRQFLRPTTSSA